jgi:hypothetical protein
VHRFLTTTLCWAGVLTAAELARWEADRPDRTSGLTVTADTTADYFRRASFQVRFASPPAGRAWLVVAYPDRGYGLVSIAPDVRQSRQWGVARLNTGKLRQAVFQLDKPGDLRIYGAPALHSLSLVNAEPEREPVPLVPPAVEFRRPSQRVTTAGADSRTLEELPEALASLRNLLPLARALGFNGIESYVKWNFVERKPGVFDWTYYDAVVAEVERHGLQWFPLLIVGSAYALPDWYYESKDNRGFECLEHRLSNPIQSIFCGTQDRYVERFLQQLGRHYGERRALLGVRLGPSGNYGEAQYPARGDWGYKWGPLHTHLGFWAADPCAQDSFRRSVRARYPSVAALNQAWAARFDSFDQVQTFLPATALTRRQRLDFAGWYLNAMSEWCERWAQWTRRALPRAVIHQSSGGWGALEIGTDYTYQARSMARLGGGIRLTNEDDNFADNFAITRMASSAARFYGAPLGYEPGGFGSARGVMARLYNCLTNGGEHLFYYHSNLYANDQAIDAWLRHASLLDRRARPRIEVAAFYPDTAILLDDEPLRYRWGSVYLVNARALRSVVDYDYVSEAMIEDGALDRYQVLVFLWGHITEKRILDRLAQWVESGGTLIYPQRPRGLLETVEGDVAISRRWQAGQTGKGRVVFFSGDPQPPEYYARFVRDELRRGSSLHPHIRRALVLDKPEFVYWSVLEDGNLALLNFEEDPVTVAGARIEPYQVTLLPLE